MAQQTKINDVPESHIEILLSWCKQNGIQIHPAIRIVSMIEKDQPISHRASSMLQRPTALVDYSDSESDESEEASDVLMHDTTRQSTAVDAGDPRRGSSAEHLDSKPDAIAGISVVSLSDIGHGTIVAQIPPHAVLSYRNTMAINLPPSASRRDNIENIFLGENERWRPFESTLSASSSSASTASFQLPDSGAHLAGRRADQYPDVNLAVTLALLSELAKHQESRWWGYLQSLPHEDLPLAIFWPDEFDAEDGLEEAISLDWIAARRRIRGTELDRYLTSQSSKDKQSSMREYYSSIVKAILPECTWREFRRAYALVSSRAFWVDAFHGLALVPIADAFNHSEENHVHLETDWGVCPLCGSLDICEHDDDDDEEQFERRKTISHTYDMVCNRSIEANEEVFNTYDARGVGNVNLLCQYGFLIEANARDTICFTEEEIAHACKAVAERNDLLDPEEWISNDIALSQGFGSVSQFGRYTSSPPTSPSPLLTRQHLNTLIPVSQQTSSHLIPPPPISTLIAPLREEEDDAEAAREEAKTLFASKMPSTRGEGASLPMAAMGVTWTRNELHVLVNEMMESSGLVAFGDEKRDFKPGGEKLRWEEMVHSDALSSSSASEIGDPWVSDDVDVSTELHDDANRVGENDNRGTTRQIGPWPGESRTPLSRLFTRESERVPQIVMQEGNHMHNTEVVNNTSRSEARMEIDADGLVSEALWTRMVGASLRLVSSMPKKKKKNSNSSKGLYNRVSSPSEVVHAENTRSRSGAETIGVIRSGQSTSTRSGRNHALNRLGRNSEESATAIIQEERSVQQRIRTSQARTSIQRRREEDDIDRNQIKPESIEDYVDGHWIEGKAGLGEEASMKKGGISNSLSNSILGLGTRSSFAHVGVKEEGSAGRVRSRSIDDGLLELVNEDEKDGGTAEAEGGMRTTKKTMGSWLSSVGALSGEEKGNWDEEIQVRKKRRLNEEVTIMSLVDTGWDGGVAARAKQVIWTTCLLMGEIIQNRLDGMDSGLGEEKRSGPVEELAVRYVQNEMALLSTCQSSWRTYGKTVLF